MGVPVSYNIRNLVQRKGTTIMTAVGIGLTVAVLIVTIALASGLNAVFSGTGHPLQLIVLRKGTDAELTSAIPSETYQIIRRLPGIAQTPGGDPMVSPEGLTVVNLPSVESPTGMNVTVRGMLPIGLAMRTITVTDGKMFTPGLRQIVVGKSIAQRYPDARLGKQIRFGRGLWDVVGVFSAGESAANSEIWADADQLHGDFETDGGSSSVLLRATDTASMETLKKTIDADQRLKTNTIEEVTYYKNLTSSGAFLMGLGAFIAVVMSIGSGFAATNTMYAAVARRSREVGTLRALGFSRGSILLSFLLESICLALLGGIVGVLIALPVNGLATGVGNFKTFSDTSFHFQVTPLAILAGLLFATLIGALGGLLPAWAASKKDIVQAMREG